MATLLIGYPDRARSATLSSVVVGGWRSSAPLSLLQDSDLGTKARSNTAVATDTQFYIALDKQRPIRVFSLLNHNFSLTAQYRLRAFSGASGTGNTLYDSGWLNVWPAIYDTLSLEWEADNWWSGTILQEDISKYPQTLILVLPQLVFAQHWQVEINDVGNAAGYVQMGGLMLAEAWQPSRNFSYGAKKGFVVRSKFEETDGGNRIFDSRKPRRTTSIALEWLNVTDSQRAFDLMSQADITTQLLLIPNADDTANLLRDAYPCTLKQLDGLEAWAYGLSKTSLVFEEVLSDG